MGKTMKGSVTYEVRHLTEWLMYVKADKMRLPVHFSGGHISGFGVTPATYTTNSRLMQALIEASPEFKCRIITKRRD